MALAIVVLALAACSAPAQPASPAATTDPSPVPTVTLAATVSPTALPVSQPITTHAAPPPLGTADGGRVFFTRGGDIWALDLPAGQTQPALRGPEDAGSAELVDSWTLSPDGQTLALARNNGVQAGALILSRLATGQLQEVGRFEGRIDALQWSHDSRRLAFLVNKRHEQSGELLEQSLRLYDTRSQGEMVLYRFSFRPDESQPALWLRAWAPGDQALYVMLALDQANDPGVLYALDVRGGEPRLVSGEFLVAGGQAVCAETSRVILRRRADPNGGAGQPSPIYAAQAGPDGSLSAIELVSPEDWLVGAVAWRPDGREIAVERLEPQRHGAYAVHLWLLTLDGAAPRQLTADPAYREEQPAWLPGDLGIVFDRWETAQRRAAGLWVIRPGKAEPRLVEKVGADPQTASWPTP